MLIMMIFNQGGTNLKSLALPASEPLVLSMAMGAADLYSMQVVC